jgi:hypothetical protein
MKTLHTNLSILLLLLVCNAQGDVPDTRGPVQNAGMHVVANAEGVQAPGYTWQEPEALSSWVAKWIVPPAAPKAVASCLRKVVNLKGAPSKVTAWITGTNYLLWVNGRAADRGPADPGRDFKGVVSNHRFYNVRDLTPLFQFGANALAVEVSGSGGGFQLQARIEYPDGSSEVIGTDETWRGISCPYLLPPTSFPPDEQKRHGKPVVLFDATAEPVGWQLPDFDDRGWDACRVGSPPGATLVMSELPPLMEVFYPVFNVKPLSGDVTIPSDPLTPGHSIVVKGDGEFTVHFSRVMAGRCGLAVDGCAGAEVYLISNETDARGGRLYWLKLREGLQYFESRDYFSLGTVRVVVRGAARPVEIRQVTADYLSQPVEYRGSFTCGDEALNTLWKSGRWSTQICMITHHLDSPEHQEPISDYGDYVIADLVNFNTMGASWLARQDLRKWAWVMQNAHYHTFHTSYVFYWLQCLLNYYDYTGDRTVIDEVAPQVHAMLDQYTTYLGRNGIISQAPNYMFMDWVTVHDDKDPAIAFPCHHPPAVIGQGYMTALFYRGLADGMRVAQLTGDQARVKKYSKLREQVASAYQAQLWNGTRGQYRDGKPFVTTVKPYKWLPADVPMESFSVQNNAFSVLYDLAPPARRQAILRGMLKNPNWDVTPFFMHFVFEALACGGLFDSEALAKMHDYVVVPETQTVREMGPDKGDYSHGWIASPTYQMSSKILGITPASPGFDAINIHPSFCGLAFARGTVPSRHGLIGVDWTRQPDQLSIKLDIPPGTHANVDLPTGGAPNPQLLLEGKPLAPSTGGATGTELRVHSIRREAGSIKFQLDSGHYQFTVPGL